MNRIYPATAWQATAWQATAWALIASLVLAGAPLAAGKPAAVVPEVSKHFGTVLKGDKFTGDFLIRNDGDAPLAIKASPSCGCMVTRYDKSIAPGQTGTLHAVVDTSALNGPFTTTVMLTTNDPNRSQIQLVLKANVEPYISLKPGHIRYVGVQGEPVEGVPQTIWAADGQSFDIESAVSPLPALTVTYREATPEERNPQGAGRQWRLETVLSGGAKVGEFSELVTIRTTHPKQHVVHVPVSGLVRPVIAITPPIADFGTVELVQPVRTSLGIHNFASEPIRVTGVSGNLPGVDVTIEPLEEGRQYRVKVTLNPSLPKGPLKGIVTVRTDSPKVPELAVEVKGTVN